MSPKHLSFALLLALPALTTSCGSGLAALGLASDSKGNPTKFVAKAFNPENGAKDAEPTDFLTLNFNQVVDLATVTDDSILIKIDGEPMLLSEFALFKISSGTSLFLALNDFTRLDTTYTIDLTTALQDKAGRNLEDPAKWTFRTRRGVWGDDSIISLLSLGVGTRMLPGRARTTILEGAAADYQGNYIYQTAVIDSEPDSPWGNPAIIYVSENSDQEPAGAGYYVSPEGPRLYAWQQGKPIWPSFSDPNLPNVRLRAAMLDPLSPHGLWEGELANDAPTIDSRPAGVPYIPWPGQFGLTTPAQGKDVHAVGGWWAWSRSDDDPKQEEFDEHRVLLAERPLPSGQAWGDWLVADRTPSDDSFYSWPLVTTLPDGSAVAVWWEAETIEGVFSPDPQKNENEWADQPIAYWMARYQPGSGWEEEARLVTLDSDPETVPRLTNLCVSPDGKYLVLAARATAGNQRDQGPILFVHEWASQGSAWDGPFPLDDGKQTRLVTDEVFLPDSKSMGRVRGMTRSGRQPILSPNAATNQVLVTWQAGAPGSTKVDILSPELRIGAFDPAGRAWVTAKTRTLFEIGPGEKVRATPPVQDSKGNLTLAWEVRTGSGSTLRWKHSTDQGETWTFFPSRDEILVSGSKPTPDLTSLSVDPASGQLMLSWNETLPSSPSGPSYTKFFR